MTNFDLAIIGGGPGGYEAAAYAARKGLSVVIFEDKNVGGTCLNVGCIPTKTLCHAADIILEMRDGEAYGIATNGTSFDLSRLMARKDEVVVQLRSGIETILSAPGITLVRARASLNDAHTVVAGGEEYAVKNVIIATGSEPAMPPIKGIDLPNVVTSTEMLSLNEVPRSLCIIGAGVIGMELASAFSAFGSEVTVVEFLKECLPAIDSDIAKRLRKQLERRGVNFSMQSRVTEITNEGVVFETKGAEKRVAADLVLVATGRKPCFGGLDLERLSIAFDKRGITVDKNFATSLGGVYAIGDVNGRMMLAHAASSQGFRAVNSIIGETDEIDFDIMPSAVFTNPEAAAVGLSEDYCKANGIDVVVRKGFYRSNGKALAMNATEGMVKLMADPCGRIIGCHAYGAHAADLIQEVAVIMNYRGNVTDLQDIIHTHPTLAEVLVNLR